MIVTTSLEKCTAQECVFNAQLNGIYGSVAVVSIRVGGFCITSGVVKCCIFSAWSTTLIVVATATVTLRGTLFLHVIDVADAVGT